MANYTVDTTNPFTGQQIPREKQIVVYKPEESRRLVYTVHGPDGKLLGYVVISEDELPRPQAISRNFDDGVESVAMLGAMLDRHARFKTYAIRMTTLGYSRLDVEIAALAPVPMPRHLDIEHLSTFERYHHISWDNYRKHVRDDRTAWCTIVNVFSEFAESPRFKMVCAELYGEENKVCTVNRYPLFDDVRGLLVHVGSSHFASL
jgi:hypothetical protein